MNSDKRFIMTYITWVREKRRRWGGEYFLMNILIYLFCENFQGSDKFDELVQKLFIYNINNFLNNIHNKYINYYTSNTNISILTTIQYP